MNFKITVLRKMSNPDMAEEYLIHGKRDCVCPHNKAGKVFYTDYDKGMPEGFCPWAWHDIYKYIALLFAGGNMKDSFDYMKDPRIAIACCTDGVRPVVYKIEVIDELPA
jgi:uncharacterized repeat protein (TIGR04076 family)